MDSISHFLNELLSVGSASGQGVSFTQGLGAIGIAYLGGVLSSLTPCVYPMIPITVSVVGGVQGGAKRPSWHEILVRGLSYVCGMAVVYSILGVVAGLTGKVFGTFTNTSGWYLGLGVIMTISALIMLDVIPFDPLSWYETVKRKLANRKAPAHGAHGHHHTHPEMNLIGAFMLGASSGFIAAPCTTPVLTSILAFIAKTQSVLLGMALMVSFSFGLGTLLLIIAAFAGALQILPKSGQWMKLIKLASGIILLIFAEYLVYRSGGLGGS